MNPAVANPLIQPWDNHNQRLVSNVHPADWRNPTPAPRYNLVVIGAGSAGLVTAVGAVGLGAKVALIEEHFLGGDCLNVGCVPSKAIIRAARAAAAIREAGEFGVNVPAGTTVDFGKAMERMRRLRADISLHDSANDRLQTTNPRIYACADICSPYQFTHAAEFTARTVIQNALFKGRAKASALIIPWCTYTSPEIAHVGLYEKDAKETGIAVDTYTLDLAKVDRAILDGETEGFVRLHVRQGADEIVGATIVAAHAGDLIGEVTLAMKGKLGLKTIAGTIHPYPTQAESIRKTGDLYNRTRLTPFVKSLMMRWLAWSR